MHLFVTHECCTSVLCSGKHLEFPVYLLKSTHTLDELSGLFLEAPKQSKLWTNFIQLEDVLRPSVVRDQAQHSLSLVASTSSSPALKTLLKNMYVYLGKCS